MTEGTSRPNIEAEIRVNAPIEAVWKALTDGDELANWFPLQARVKPGVGGSIWLSWGDFEADTPISVWEENKRLKVVYLEPMEGSAEPPMPPIPFQIAVDYILSGDGGSTVLRVVHSGFSRDAGWDDQYDGTVRGWALELNGLKHYLEQHRGTKRRVLQSKQFLDEGSSLKDAWLALMGANGLAAEGTLADLNAGDRFDVTTAAGDHLSGVIRIRTNRDLCATVENMNHALIRLRVDEGSLTAPGMQVNMFLSTYGLPSEQTDGIQARMDELLAGLFSSAAAD